MNKFLPRFQIFAFLFFLFPFMNTNAQTGGASTYSFLNMVSPARTAALGGNTVAIRDHDISLSAGNPSLLNSEMQKQLSVSAVNYFAGINYGNIMYGMKADKLNTLSSGIRYADYGRIQETDANGDETGRNVSAMDMTATVALARNLGGMKRKGLLVSKDSLFTAGLALNLIYSNIADYTSLGLTVDAGISYYNTRQNLGFTLLGKNIGRQLKPYYKDHIEPIRPQLTAGFSKKFNRAPLRLILTLQHLEIWNLRNTNNEIKSLNVNLSGTESEKKSEIFLDNFFRHFIFAFELLPGKNFYLRAGYNVNRRRELMVLSRKAISGFTWGFGFRISKFHLSYANAVYSIAGATNHITLAFNLGELTTRKRYYNIEGGK